MQQVPLTLTPYKWPRMVSWYRSDNSVYRTCYHPFSMEGPLARRTSSSRSQGRNCPQMGVRGRSTRPAKTKSVSTPRTPTLSNLDSFERRDHRTRTCMPRLRNLASCTASQSNWRFPGSAGSPCSHPPTAAVIAMATRSPKVSYVVYELTEEPHVR